MKVPELGARSCSGPVCMPCALLLVRLDAQASGAGSIALCGCPLCSLWLLWSVPSGMLCFSLLMLSCFPSLWDVALGLYPSS